MRILFVSHDTSSIMNRRTLIEFLKSRNLEVAVISPKDENSQKIDDLGINHIEWKVNRKSLNPIKEQQAIAQLSKIFDKYSPDLIHSSSIKPNLYTGLALREWGGAYKRKKKFLNVVFIPSVTGLGYIFNSKSLKSLIIKTLIKPLFKKALSDCKTIALFENPSDLTTYVKQGITTSDRSAVLPISGVDTEAYTPKSKYTKNNGSIIVLMASRLLRDKGVLEYDKAATTILKQNQAVEFWLAGGEDAANPSALNNRELISIKQKGALNLLGHQDDLPKIIHQADIAVLPSYHEGLSRFLLMSASAGLPIITTDIPGNHTLISNNKNGILIPIKDPDALAKAIRGLITNASERENLGTAIRKTVVEKFDSKLILEKYCSIYKTLGLKI